MRSLLLVLAGCGSSAAEPAFGPAPYAPAVQAGTLVHPDLIEVSGIVAARRGEGLWAVADSGNAARLVHIGPDGAVIGRYDVDGVENDDWEALTSFERDGRSWLVVGDTGDNGADRDHVVLHVIEEPVPGLGEGRVAVAWSVPFRFPEGARDTEALAVDGDRVILVTKRTDPPEIWSLPLEPSAMGSPTRLGIVPNLPPVSNKDAFLGTFKRRLPAMPTDLAIAADRVVLLTYDAGYVWNRVPGEDWPTVFGRPPTVLPIPPMPQQEALCFGPDGRTVWVTTEDGDAPLYRIDPL